MNDLAGTRNLIKMSCVMPFSFNAVELCVVTINEKPWTRAGEVCMALRYELSGTTVPGKIFSIIIS